MPATSYTPVESCSLDKTTRSRQVADLKTNNFLTVIPDVEAVIKAELLNDPSKTHLPISIDDGPLLTYVVLQPLPLPQDLTNLHVNIADLGVKHFTDLIQTQPLRAPEVVIGAGWDKSCDVWSIGCLTYEMVMGQWLFPAKLQQHPMQPL
ncbi:hypothetical protein K439DRAFT_1560824 [Ramaria rubella]|nr:hypothetical protein K439DRAFT_1560824 [Ramaria rubella]